MIAPYWLKQTAAKPLFSDLLWSRPENKVHAGKLAIIGGNAFGFAAVAEAYQAATRAGIGTARVLLPEAVKKVVGPVLAEGEFAPSNPSGSFSQKALSDLLDLAGWADAILLAGDLGRNSETAILLESFAGKYQGALGITKDAADYFTSSPASILSRTDTTLTISLSQLQKLFSSAHAAKAITFGMDLIQLVDALHEFTTIHPLEIIVKHGQNLVVATQGQVSTTKLETDLPVWRVQYATRAAVWRLQNPQKPFEALTMSVIYKSSN